MTRQKVAAFLIAMICMMFSFSPVLAQKPRSQSPGVISFKDKAAQVRQQMPSMRQAWLAASDPATKKKLGREMVDQAVHYKDDEEYDGLIYEVAAGGPIAGLEIKIPAKTKAVKVKSGLTITSFDRQKFTAWTWHWTEAAPFIERRITKNAVEVWTPKEGWLFSGRGKLLNHAIVPRRDGKGQQWYGAFRPDGCWVTTALWERDDTLFLYAKNGKFLKDLPSLAIAPPEEPGRKTGGIIGWARADKDGTGWVLAVMGDYGPGGHAWISPELTPRPLKGIEPWKRCYPRQLGGRWDKVPSDDGKLMLEGYEAGHGYRVGYPYFTLQPLDAAGNLPKGDPNPERLAFNVTLPGRGPNLGGFWPGSHNVYLFDKEQRTWFFDEHGRCQGWIAARRFADAADGQSMLFKTPDGRLATLTPNLKVREVRRFVNVNGESLNPQGIYDDLHLGLFFDSDRLGMASWGRAWYDPRGLLEWAGRPVRGLVGLVRKIGG